MDRYLFRKLRKKRIWDKIFIERFTEPVHLNLLSIFFWIFGSYRQKICYDLIIRPQYAFPILTAADFAMLNNIKTISILEFGVASGSGLLNMARIAKKVSSITGVSIKIYGFDTGRGMPKPQSYRDHPEYYSEGDFKMNFEVLRKNLPDYVELVIGDVEKTIPAFCKKLSEEEPIGFISFDLDYYSSTKSAFKVLSAPNSKLFLPLTMLYFDDIALPHHNEFCGELLAIKEFNLENEVRKIEHHRFLETTRVFRRPQWIKQIFYFHVLDHPARNHFPTKFKKRQIENPYLTYENNVENFDV